jgi:single-strand DNA-binding protein
MALNVFNFTARIGKDCGIRYTDGGDAVVNFTAAVSSGYGDKEVTTWVNCSMFGKRGESVSPYLLKGTQIAVSGELTNRKYTDKSGNEKYSLDVRVNDVTLLGGKQEAQQSAQPARSQPAPVRQAQSVEDMDDDVPF